MGWVKRDADRHRHDMPKSEQDFGMKSVVIGDVWQCRCGIKFAFTGWDEGVQWDPYPAVAKWRIVDD